MKDEIKEILDNINDKWEDYYVQDIVSNNDLKQLLDYIINLQEENERLQNIIDKSIKYASETRDILDCYHNGEWIDMVDILYGNEIEDDD